MHILSCILATVSICCLLNFIISSSAAAINFEGSLVEPSSSHIADLLAIDDDAVIALDTPNAQQLARKTRNIVITLPYFNFYKGFGGLYGNFGYNPYLNPSVYNYGSYYPYYGYGGVYYG